VCLCGKKDAHGLARLGRTRPCLHHPTSDQAPKSSSSTPTRRALHHLISSAQELGFNSDSSGLTSLQIKRFRARVQPRLVRPDITSDQALQNSGSIQTRQARHHLSNHQRARFSLDSGSFWKSPPAQLNGGILGTTRLDLNYVNRTDLTSS